MSIPEIKERIKGLGRLLFSKDTVAVLLVVFTATASFGLGRLSALSETRVPIEVVSYPFGAFVEAQSTTPIAGESLEGGYVASRNGGRYHLPWCPGASQIREENKIWFQTKEAAEQAGYTPAQNCKGM